MIFMWEKYVCRFVVGLKLEFLKRKILKMKMCVIVVYMLNVWGCKGKRINDRGNSVLLL